MDKRGWEGVGKSEGDVAVRDYGLEGGRVHSHI